MTTTVRPLSTSLSSSPNKLIDVVEMQAGGGLVEDVDIGVAAHLYRQLETLALAGGERVERLAELDVAQTHVHETLENEPGGLVGGEEVGRLLGGHGEHLEDVLAPEPVLED